MHQKKILNKHAGAGSNTYCTLALCVCARVRARVRVCVCVCVCVLYSEKKTLEYNKYIDNHDQLENYNSSSA